MDPTSLDVWRQQLDGFLWPDGDPRLRRKRERILLAATELFVRQGYRKTTIEEVARAAGVAKGTVYLYYSNKAELVYHAIALEERHHLERLAPALDASLPARERLRNVLKLSLQIPLEMPLTRTLTLGEHEISLAIAEQDARVLEDVNSRQRVVITSLLRAALGAHASDDALTLRAQALIDFCHALIASPRPNPSGLPPELHADVLADTLLDGVLAPTTESRCVGVKP